MTAHVQPIPIDRKLLTPGVQLLLAVAAVGVVAGLYRFFVGLQASTNLNQQYPWGIWIIGDVSLIALGAGGFTTAAIAHVFHREMFHALARPALITAMLGYTFACVLLAADLGRYYNIWHPIIMWQGNSALFEVGMCVVCYLTVLYVEFIPVFCERVMDDVRWPRLGRVCAAVNGVVSRTMFIFLVLGVAISCLHQSSLGHVMVLAGPKLHALWSTPILALMFLLSAIMVGFPTVIVASIWSSWALGLRVDMRMLGALAKYTPVFLAVYLGFKVGDMFIRRSYVFLFDGSVQSIAFWIEMGAGVMAPLIMLSSARVRNAPRWLCTASVLVMLGVILNRANVYLIGYRPLNVIKVYHPSVTEWVLTIGAAAGLLVCWRVLATYFPVISPTGPARGCERR